MCAVLCTHRQVFSSPLYSANYNPFNPTFPNTFSEPVDATKQFSVLATYPATYHTAIISANTAAYCATNAPAFITTSRSTHFVSVWAALAATVS